LRKNPWKPGMQVNMWTGAQSPCVIACATAAPHASPEPAEQAKYAPGAFCTPVHETLNSWKHWPNGCSPEDQWAAVHALSV